MSVAKKIITEYLRTLDIHINGKRAHDIHVHNEKVFNQVFRHGTSAFAETFELGWWDVDDLATVAERIICSRIDRSTEYNQCFSIDGKLLAFLNKCFNRQSKVRARMVAETHYNLNHQLFESMLDEDLHYSSAMWSNAHDTLTQAQKNKMAYIARSINIRPGFKILDIGCGWGGVARYFADQHQAEVVGISVSEQQLDWCNQTKGQRPIQYVNADYREFQTDEKFDAIISLGFLEAVGRKNQAQFFANTHTWLKPNGKVFLQTTVDVRRCSLPSQWLDTYIFPNGVLPTMHEIIDSTIDLYSLRKFKDISDDYNRTLIAWWNNFNAHTNELCEQGIISEREARRWKFYLQAIQPVYRTGIAQELLLVFDKSCYTK